MCACQACSSLPHYGTCQLRCCALQRRRVQTGPSPFDEAAAFPGHAQRLRPVLLLLRQAPLKVCWRHARTPGLPAGLPDGSLCAQERDQLKVLRILLAQTIDNVTLLTCMFTSTGALQPSTQV